MNRLQLACVIALAAIAAVLPSAARPQTPDVYKIGMTWPLTGPLAAIASESLIGAQIAIDDINRGGGVRGKRVQLLVEDSQGAPQAGVAAFQKLVQIDGVQVIYTSFGNVIGAQLPLAESLKVPMLTTTEVPGLFDKYQYGFSHASTIGVTLPLMTEMWKTKHVKRVFALLVNSAYGQLVSPLAKAAAQAAGATYDEVLLDPNSTDFRGVLSRVKDFNPDAIVVAAQASGMEATAIKQTRELGVTAQIYNVSQAYQIKSWRDAVGPYAEGMIYAGLNLDPNVAKNFIAAYHQRAGYDPSFIAAEGYDVMHILAYCLGKAGNTGVAIQGCLSTLNGVPSVMGGTISMGPNHYTRFRAVGLWQAVNGNLVKVASAQ